VNYEKYKSISILYPIDYHKKKRYGIPTETLIIRRSQAFYSNPNHLMVGIFIPELL
jgi:hypothetical protein